MVPKSLPHQTLAKLFSETDRLFLFFSFSINSTELIIVGNAIFVKCWCCKQTTKKPESFEGFGFVYTLIILLFYTQTPNV
jgi:hypothetical protein